MRVLFSRPANGSREAIVAHYVRLYQAIGSPGFPTDEAELVQRIGMAVDRNYHPAGTVRQMVAIAADTTRAEALARIAKPTLVLHGHGRPAGAVGAWRRTRRGVFPARVLPASKAWATTWPGRGRAADAAYGAVSAGAPLRGPHTMLTPEQSQLGKASAYPDQYDAALLYPIARAPNRSEIGVGATLPFLGADLWTAFELGWLNRRGKPQVALGHFTVPCETPNIIESKSFKLYLGSFNNTRVRRRGRGAGLPARRPERGLVARCAGAGQRRGRAHPDARAVRPRTGA